MTQRAVVLRHVLFEDLGLLEPLVCRRGYDVEYLDAGTSLDSAATADLLIVLGGPIGVYDEESYPFLADERRLLATRLREQRATLGICLGAQLMAAALGAPVTPTGRKEIGYAPVTLTDEGRASVLAPLRDVPVLHWHGDQFAIPEGAQRLAETEGFPHQAFAIGSHALGLQFHLEADHTVIERWLIGHAHELGSAGIDVTRIRSDAAQFGPELAQSAGLVFDAWLDGLRRVRE